MKIKKGSSFATWTKKLQGSWPSSKSKTKTGKGKLFLARSRKIASEEEPKETKAERAGNKSESRYARLDQQEKNLKTESHHQDQRDDVSISESIEKRLDCIEQRLHENVNFDYIEHHFHQSTGLDYIEQRLHENVDLNCIEERFQEQSNIECIEQQFEENVVSVPSSPSSLVEERSQGSAIQDDHLSGISDEGSRANPAADFEDSGSEAGEKSTELAHDPVPFETAPARESSFVSYLQCLVNSEKEEDIYQASLPNFLQESGAATSNDAQPVDVQLGVQEGAEESRDEYSFSQRITTGPHQETPKADLKLEDHEKPQMAATNSVSENCDDKVESKADKSLDGSFQEYALQPETPMPTPSIARNSIVDSFSVDAESQCSSQASSSSDSEESGEAKDVEESAASDKDYIPVGSASSEQEEMPQDKEITVLRTSSGHSAVKLPSSNSHARNETDDDSVSIKLPPCMNKASNNNKTSNSQAKSESVSVTLPSSNSKTEDDMVSDKLPSSNSTTDNDMVSDKLPSSDDIVSDKLPTSNSTTDNNLESGALNSDIPFTKTSSSSKRFDEGAPNSSAALSIASFSTQQHDHEAVRAKDVIDAIFAKKTMKNRMLQEKKALGRVKLLKRKKPKEPSVVGVGEVITSAGSTSSHLLLSSSSTKLRIAPTKVMSNTEKPRSGVKFEDESHPKGKKRGDMICWFNEKDSVEIVSMQSEEAAKTLKEQKASVGWRASEVDSRDSISNQSSASESQTGTGGRTKTRKQKGKSKKERVSYEAKIKQRNSGMSSSRREGERRGKSSRNRPALSRVNSDLTVEEKCACNEDVVNNTRVLCGDGEAEEAAGCRDEMTRDLRDMAKEFIRSGPSVLLDWLN